MSVCLSMETLLIEDKWMGRIFTFVFAGFSNFAFTKKNLWLLHHAARCISFMCVLQQEAAVAYHKALSGKLQLGCIVFFSFSAIWEKHAVLAFELSVFLTWLLPCNPPPFMSSGKFGKNNSKEWFIWNWPDSLRISNRERFISNWIRFDLSFPGSLQTNH